VDFRNDPIKKYYQWTIRKRFITAIVADVVWSPFEIIYLVLNITVQSMKKEDYEVKFNLMNHNSTFQKLSYTE